MFKDTNKRDLFKVKIKEKNFALNPMEEDHKTFKSKKSVTKIRHKRLDHQNNTESKTESKKKKKKHHDFKDNVKKSDSNRNNDIVKVVVSSKDVVAYYINSVEESRNNTSQRKQKVFHKQPSFLKQQFFSSNFRNYGTGHNSHGIISESPPSNPKFFSIVSALESSTLGRKLFQTTKIFAIS